jgi:hypothetical protein
MEQDRIEAAIADAPAWAKIGLTMPNDYLRAQSTRELANCILDALDKPFVPTDQNQLPLPL